MPLHRSVILASLAVFGAAMSTAAADEKITTPVFASCQGGNSPCTATAVCPGDKKIESGWATFTVPDGVGPAYGICGNATQACVVGTTSCAITTSYSTCGAPGWTRQFALVAIGCR